VACRPKMVYVTDIHEPTLLNATHNVQLNAGKHCDGKFSILYYFVALLALRA